MSLFVVGATAIIQRVFLSVVAKGIQIHPDDERRVCLYIDKAFENQLCF